ncbi:hypothetical protein K438DRAFT_1970876 [Mycena galopus ATCC 62051]|nr:hypothetical protein K438DRAFT_1970876 [Mycena galopus ATCC 62051]
MLWTRHVLMQQCSGGGRRRIGGALTSGGRVGQMCVCARRAMGDGAQAGWGSEQGMQVKRRQLENREGEGSTPGDTRRPTRTVSLQSKHLHSAPFTPFLGGVRRGLGRHTQSIPTRLGRPQYLKQ